MISLPKLSLLRGDEGESHPLSSDSDAESQSSSCIQGKKKRVDKSYTNWMFLDTFRADVSHGGFDQNKQQLIQHFQTRTAHDMPQCVQSITISADLTAFISARPDVTPTVSIAIVGYVQTKKSRTFAINSWIPSATWNPVSGGLCSNSEFLADMKGADDPSMPGWCKLPIFGTLGLNNQGRNAAKNERKVFAHFQAGSGFIPPIS
jgi:hypothetical protein